MSAAYGHVARAMLRRPQGRLPADLLVCLLVGLAVAMPAEAQQCSNEPDPASGLEAGRLRGPRDCVGAPPAAQDQGIRDRDPDAAAPEDTPAFVLRETRFSGNTIFPDDALRAQLAPWLGATVRYAEVEQMSKALTDHYRRAGYVLANVVAAPQEVVDGALRFDVFEGRLSRVRIEAPAGEALPDALIAATLAPLRSGEALRLDALERAMLLLGDLPGLAPQASLEAGDAPGSFDLIVDMNRSARVVAGVDADNHGARASGTHRLGAFARLNSPLGMGDSLDARLARTLEHGQTFGRIAYEAPLPHPGLRAGIGYARTAYELGDQFAALEARGRAEIAELSLSQALLRSRERNLAARLSFERKLLRDEFRALSQRYSRSASVLGAALDYEGRDQRAGGGYTGAMLTAYLGCLSIDTADALAADQSASGPHTQGRYARLLYRVSRLQAVGATGSVYVALSGQWANRNLDSAEKIALGGPYAVRAYSTAAGLGDEGQLLNLEYRLSPWPQAAFSLFFDAGRVRISHDAPPGADNRRLLKGAGLGVAWNPLPGLSLNASLAWRLGDADVAQEDRMPRLYAQLRKVF